MPLPVTGDDDTGSYAELLDVQWRRRRKNTQVQIRVAAREIRVETYTADGSDPYLTDEGEGGPNYPLGVTITHDKMLGEEGPLFAFGEDRFIYCNSITAYGEWGQMEPHQWDSGKYIEGGYRMFYPAPPFPASHFCQLQNQGKNVFEQNSRK